MFEHDYQNYPELTNKEIQEFGFTSPHQQITEDFRATVIKVHDGDTVTLRVSFRNFDFPLRFADIDSEELSEGGEEAREWLKTKILNQEVDVLINSDNRVGKYGRLLGTIVFNGASVAEEEILLGLAKPFGLKKESEVVSSSKIFSLKQWF